MFTNASSLAPQKKTESETIQASDKKTPAPPSSLFGQKDDKKSSTVGAPGLFSGQAPSSASGQTLFGEKSDKPSTSSFGGAGISKSGLGSSMTGNLGGLFA